MNPNKKKLQEKINEINQGNEIWKEAIKTLNLEKDKFNNELIKWKKEKEIWDKKREVIELQCILELKKEENEFQPTAKDLAEAGPSNLKPDTFKDLSYEEKLVKLIEKNNEDLEKKQLERCSLQNNGLNNPRLNKLFFKIIGLNKRKKDQVVPYFEEPSDKKTKLDSQIKEEKWERE